MSLVRNETHTADTHELRTQQPLVLSVLSLYGLPQGIAARSCAEVSEHPKV